MITNLETSNESCALVVRQTMQQRLHAAGWLKQHSHSGESVSWLLLHTARTGWVLRESFERIDQNQSVKFMLQGEGKTMRWCLCRIELRACTLMPQSSTPQRSEPPDSHVMPLGLIAEEFFEWPRSSDGDEHSRERETRDRYLELALERLAAQPVGNARVSDLLFGPFGTEQS